MLFYFSSKAEQRKIASLFNQLDKAIALHQEKLDRLDELKKGYMQNVLPQKEQDLPKVRFTHYHGKWEQCKLGKIANIKMGQSPNGNSYTNNPNDHILVQGNADLKNGEVVPRVWTTQVTKTANPKDIILSVRAPVGDVAKTNYSVVLGRGVAGIDGNEFIYQNLLNLKVNGYWKRYSTGSTFESINSNDLKDASIFVPSKKEQYMIGDLLEKLDKNIFLQQTKINKLVDLKKSFLQRMFI
jgi:type I restriction enzyme S subunit